MRKETANKPFNRDKELKKVIRDKKISTFLYWLIFLSPFAIFFVYIKLCKNVSDYMAMFAFSISIMALAVTVKTNYINEYNSKVDRLLPRKVIPIEPKNISEIRKEIEGYLDKELVNKTIDKIELINTSVGINDNRKEGFIIYH